MKQMPSEEIPAHDEAPEAFSNNGILLDHEYRLSPLVQVPMIGVRVVTCFVVASVIIVFGLGIPEPLLERYFYHPSWLWAVAAIFILWPLLAYRFWAFQLRKYDIIVGSGVLFRREISIPWSRIQQVDSKANPLDRICGLKRLVLHSAGSRAGKTAIPGIPLELATLLQGHLAHIVERFHGSKSERIAKYTELMKQQPRFEQDAGEEQKSE